MEKRNSYFFYPRILLKTFQKKGGMTADEPNFEGL